MATFAYDCFLADLDSGNYNPSTATFMAMLVDNTYSPDKSGHTKRSQVTGEITGASGYTAGGLITVLARSTNNAAHRRLWTFSSPLWSSASITARGLVIYNARGGAASADELVAYIDFGMDVTSSNGTFSSIFSTPLTFQN
jgi:hypothetical protein